MLKRILMCLSALLLAACLLSACAEEDAYQKTMNAMYRLVLRTDAGDQPLGSGVLFLQQDVLLTAASCCQEGEIVAIGADGEHAVATCDLSPGRGIALLELETPSSMAPLGLTDYDCAALPYLFGTDAMTNMGVMNLYQILDDLYQGRLAVVLSAEEGLLPGAVMVDEQGDVISLVIAQKAEGLGMYIAQEASGLYAAITGSDEEDAFLPLTITWDGGLLTATWEDEVRDSGVYYLTISGEENNYYTSYELEPDRRSIELAVPPGHGYLIQVQWTPSVAEAHAPVWSAMSRFTVPMGTFTDYGFQQRCYLAVAPAGTAAEGLLSELTGVTDQSLSDAASDIYLQVVNIYDVAAEISFPMTLSLTAPDGQFYFEESGYLFSPEYEAYDAFAMPLDELLADCRYFSGGTLQTGEYTLSYAIGGRVAGEYTFTVREEGAQAETTYGFLTGMTADSADGRITLAWDGSAIPEGAQLKIYYLYDGNSYYSYYNMKQGAESTEIAAVPGRLVMVWGVWSLGDEPMSVVPERADQYLVVEGIPEETLTLNGFANLRCSVVASQDPQAAEKGAYLPEVPLTREALLDPETILYFQTEDTYQAQAVSDGHPLALVLCSPDGMVYVDYSAYVFDPAYNGSDLWLKDITAIFATCSDMAVGEPWPAGEYTLLYLIDGQTAGQFTFTLE